MILVAGSNNAYNLQQQKTNIAAAKNKEKEEEKRRLQAEMRRREQELLNKIKEQQKFIHPIRDIFFYRWTKIMGSFVGCIAHK